MILINFKILVFLKAVKNLCGSKRIGKSTNIQRFYVSYEIEPRVNISKQTKSNITIDYGIGRN
jgi:hypothetical protein